LYRYTKHRDGPQGNAWFDDDGRRLAPDETRTAEEQYDEVGRYKSNPVGPEVETTSAYSVKKRSQAFAFTCNLYRYDEVLGELLDVATGSADANLTMSAAADDLINKLGPTAREREFINAYMSDLYVAPMVGLYKLNP
jgi:hypothetical protein